MGEGQRVCNQMYGVSRWSVICRSVIVSVHRGCVDLLSGQDYGRRFGTAGRWTAMKHMSVTILCVYGPVGVHVVRSCEPWRTVSRCRGSPALRYRSLRVCGFQCGGD